MRALTLVRSSFSQFGFHGLSYSSLLSTLSSHLSRPPSDVSAVVAHLGSGGSVCMVERGQSKDTSMGLTPLEGLVGGTRSGSIDPTLIFHHTPDCASNALDGDDGRFVSKAEITLNKCVRRAFAPPSSSPRASPADALARPIASCRESGLKALAGTTDFGLITQRIEGAVQCSDDEKRRATLAYDGASLATSRHDPGHPPPALTA